MRRPRAIRCSRARPLLESSEPAVLGLAASELLYGELYVGNYEDGARLLSDLVARIREQGALSALPYALAGPLLCGVLLGHWRAAYALATESRALADEVGQHLMSPMSRLVIALIAGAQGRLGEARKRSCSPGLADRPVPTDPHRQLDSDLRKRRWAPRETPARVLCKRLRLGRRPARIYAGGDSYAGWRSRFRVWRTGQSINMTIGTSIFLIALGAILAFAVNATLAGISIQTAGVILIAVGVLGLVIGLFMLSRRPRDADRTVYEDRPLYR